MKRSRETSECRNASECPRCGSEGRSVTASTIAAMVDPATRARLTALDGFRFCPARECDVAYFHTASGELVLCSEVVVPIFQKSPDPERLVCYCFKHTVLEIQQEANTESGASRIAAEIKARCAQGLDDCERNNPQGSCCLGNVQRVFRDAVASSAPQRPPPDTGDGCKCCRH